MVYSAMNRYPDAHRAELEYLPFGEFAGLLPPGEQATDVIEGEDRRGALGATTLQSGAAESSPPHPLPQLDDP
jgi:hypothetical protein